LRPVRASVLEEAIFLKDAVSQDDQRSVTINADGLREHGFPTGAGRYGLTPQDAPAVSSNADAQVMAFTGFHPHYRQPPEL